MLNSSASSKRVLVTPLDWGLGHATRCIPVIRELIRKGCEVFIASSGDALALLKSEFPSLVFFELPAYRPAYPKKGSMVWKMAAQLPRFVRTIRREHESVDQIVKQHHINMVVSDNRFGCWSTSVPSVFITHQSNILMPQRFGWLQGLVRRMNENMIGRFSRCWIPDYPNENRLSGELISFGTYRKTLDIQYIGSLSRFKPCHTVEITYDVIVICSGPEPQRSLFEDMMMRQLATTDIKYFFVRGVVEDVQNTQMRGNAVIVNYLTGNQLEHEICRSGLVIARSGYSTIMDMKALGKKMICVPTPGQTEQEYLAKRLEKKGIAFYMTQKKFDLNVALSECARYTGFFVEDKKDDLLEVAVERLLEM